MGLKGLEAMAVSFKEFAFTIMYWLANALWVLVSSFVIRLLSLDFKQKSQTDGVSGGEEVAENKPDDRISLAAEIFRFDSGFETFCEEENSFDSLGVSNATTSKYEFVGGNSFCGFIEQPLNTSFKVHEHFLESSFEDGVTKISSVDEEQSVLRELQEFDDEIETGDFIVHQEAKSDRFASTDTSLGDDFREVDDHGNTELLVCSEQSVDREFGEIDDQVKTESPLDTDSEGFGEIGACDEVSSDEGDHKGTGEALDYRKPSLDEGFRQEDEDGKSHGGIVDDKVEIEPPLDKDSAEFGEIGVCDEVSLVEGDHKGTGETPDRHKPSSDEGFQQEDEDEDGKSHGGIVDLVDLKDCIPIKGEEKLNNLDPDEHDEQVGSPRENHLMFSFKYVSQKPSSLTNDFWHTNGKFIADFDEFYCYEDTIEEELGPETPMGVDTKSVDPYEEDISDLGSSDSDDDHQGSVMNHEEDYCEKSGQLDMQKPSNRALDEDDEMDIDVLLEHQSYVQKMKKEMKHLRAIGLPTILEDSESPRMDEDLKPLKINEKVGHKDQVNEIQRFYKTYSDKMKRLDILCHQTMYAVGILQLKNPDANKKLSLPSIKSLLAHNLLPNKFRKHESDPVIKLIRDLQKDLELVYVGQLCLSWEILKWQHAKAEELQLFDTMGLRQYGLVAGEFQQFHVLVQRFSEDEPFQGARVENYVSRRCANCNFLQVPPIKDDSKNNERKDAVSIVKLTEVIEESMHAFWEFIRTDKKEASNVGVRDPLNAKLLSDIKTTLAKKERRLKDLIRSGNCLVKKFQKHPECRLTRELLLAQVEIKIVMRVIKMPRLTSDQLLWCRKKLSKINMLGKKVHVESSFSLFPC